MTGFERAGAEAVGSIGRLTRGRGGPVTMEIVINARPLAVDSLIDGRECKEKVMSWRMLAKGLTSIVAVASAVVALSGSPAHASGPEISDSLCSVVLGTKALNNRVRLCLTVVWSGSSDGTALHVKVGTSAQFDGDVQTSATNCTIEYSAVLRTLSGDAWELPRQYSTGRTDCYRALRKGSYAYFIPLDSDTSAYEIESAVIIHFTYANGGETVFDHDFGCLNYQATCHLH